MADPGFQKEGGALIDKFESNVFWLSFTLKKLNLGQKAPPLNPPLVDISQKGECMMPYRGEHWKGAGK